MDLIRSENKDTQQNIEKAQKSLENNDNQIYSLLNNVDKTLIKEIERSKYKYENLTDEQRSIKNYVESINNLMKKLNDCKHSLLSNRNKYLNCNQN